jgi:UDP-3-O-[3-hydroxymyristoyl] glucosamine N-acyltransferase
VPNKLTQIKMIDSKFHKKNGSPNLAELAKVSGCKLYDEKFSNFLVKNLAPLETASEGDLTFFQNIKYLNQFKNTKASVCIVSEKFIDKAPAGIALLISENPYYAFAIITQRLFYQKNRELKISEKAHVEDSAEIGSNTIISSGCYIGANCVIGKNCVIHPNVTITNSIIGNNVIIHAGSSIGQDGFGYAFHNGKHHKVMQLGRVIIENDVEIGANTCIDRGSVHDTIIGEGSKLDNMVQIAHNVKVGKHCVFAAQVGVAGSTEFGNYVVIGGQAGVGGHIKIGNRVTISARSGVFKDINDGETVGGFPAVPIKQFHRQSLALAKLIEKKGQESE